MPRHTHSKQLTAPLAAAQPNEAAAACDARPSEDIDAQALALRESGKSFSAIARTLGMDRATEAHRSYVRALGDTKRATSAGNWSRTRRHGSTELEQRIRDRDAADVPKVERRLLGVKKLREAIRQ